MRVRARACLFALGIVCTTSAADAAGLYLADRGVRPLGRGGAFVAGVDDLNAIWYNPAGLADAGSSILVDFAWVNFSSEYTRKSNVVDSGGTVRTYDYPQVNGTTPFLPIPMLAASYNFGKKKEFTAAFGVTAPYVAVASYPLTVNGQPSPSRYSLVSLDGSALAVVGYYFSYKPIEQIRIGLGIQALVGTFKARVVFSASPSDRLIGAPEDPAYDALTEMSVGPIVAPSGNFGFVAEPDKRVRLGLTAQLPYWINSPATLKVRLPTAAPFENASQDGEAATVRFRLPPILGAGIEYRGDFADEARLRLELTYVREFWSLHDSIDVRPENVTLRNVTGFPSPFSAAGLSLPRRFQDSNSFRLGSEYSVKSIIKDYRTDLRAGISYETSAIPEQYVSPLTYDANKLIGSLGAGIHIAEHWRIDAMGALVLLDGTTVKPEEAQITRVNPIKGNPTKTEAINGGTYSARAIIVGLGLNYKF